MATDVKKAPIRSRTVIRADRAVAAQWWTKPWTEVLAAAEAGTEGLRVDSQQSDDAGFWKLDNVSGQATLIPGERGCCELWQQGW